MHSHSHNRIKKHPTNKHRRCFFSLLAVLSLVGHTSHTNVLGDADLLTAITVVAVEVATTGEVLLVPAGAKGGRHRVRQWFNCAVECSLNCAVGCKLEFCHRAQGLCQAPDRADDASRSAGTDHVVTQHFCSGLPNCYIAGYRCGSLPATHHSASRLLAMFLGGNSPAAQDTTLFRQHHDKGGQKSNSASSWHALHWR